MKCKVEESSLSLFPEYEATMSDVLFVIGNGFDLAHGIKSSYWNFREWVEKEKGQSPLVGMMDVFFSNQRDFWGDIEQALGEYEEADIVDYCKPNEELDYDHPTRSVAEIQDSPDSIFFPIIESFIDSFSDWVDSIDISRAFKAFQLPLNGKYLTFNYTETLESVYGIPEENVLHIHGSRIKKDEYIIGHNNIRSESEAYDDDAEYPFIQETYEKIISRMNEFAKHPTAIIQKTENQIFFKHLSVIRKVIVLGHSLYSVDLPYFEEIMKYTGPNILWKFSCHSEKDKKNIYEFIRHKGLTNVELIYL